MKQSYFHPYRGIPVCRSKVILLNQTPFSSSYPHMHQNTSRPAPSYFCPPTAQAVRPEKTSRSPPSRYFLQIFPPQSRTEKTPCRLHRQRAAYYLSLIHIYQIGCPRHSRMFHCTVFRDIRPWTFLHPVFQLCYHLIGISAVRCQQKCLYKRFPVSHSV